MANSSAAHAVAPALDAPEGEVRDLLYKSDRPRAIDQHIDFFGDGGLSDVAVDGCGELFLESLA